MCWWNFVDRKELLRSAEAVQKKLNISNGKRIIIQRVGIVFDMSNSGLLLKGIGKNLSVNFFNWTTERLKRTGHPKKRTEKGGRIISCVARHRGFKILNSIFLKSEKAISNKLCLADSSMTDNVTQKSNKKF